MATRSRRDRLEVSNDPGQPTHAPPSEEQPPVIADEIPYAEPEQYGVRTSWQSEAVRIEAAEFLLATRVQEERQWRLRRMIDRLRLQGRVDRGA